MMRTLNIQKEICPNQLLSIPIDGRWIWDEKKKELVYESRNYINENKKIKSNEVLKLDIRTGLITYRKQNRPLQYIIKTKDNNKITLIDVIQASLNVMSEMFYIPIEFEEYVRTPEVREYLLYLLNYFYWFFETMNNASPKNEQHIDRSQNEKNRIRSAYAYLLIALRELGCRYGVLLLGINLKDYHHMRNGDLSYSCTNIDRTIFESLFIFSTYFIWITFYRQYFDSIRIELARLFRAGGDIEMLKVPITESLEDRMKNDLSNSPIARHKLIDCTEYFSKSMAKKSTINRTSDIHDRKMSMLRRSSMFWNLNDIPDESESIMKQHRSKSRLKSLLAKDFDEQGLMFIFNDYCIACYLSIGEAEKIEEFYIYSLDGRSPYYRQRHKLLVSQRKNRIRGILTRQLKSRNQSLIGEQYHRLKNDKKTKEPNAIEIENKIQERQKIKQERFAIRRLLSSSSSYKNSSLLPIPANPLDDPRKEKQSILPQVDFKLKENIGIIGKLYSDFDLIRLTLKPNSKNNISMPEEFLVTLPDKI